MKNIQFCVFTDCMDLTCRKRLNNKELTDGQKRWMANNSVPLDVTQSILRLPDCYVPPKPNPKIHIEK